jgi:hypothetical protein
MIDFLRARQLRFDHVTDRTIISRSRASYPEGGFAKVLTKLGGRDACNKTVVIF